MLRRQHYGEYKGFQNVYKFFCDTNICFEEFVKQISSAQTLHVFSIIVYSFHIDLIKIYVRKPIKAHKP